MLIFLKALSHACSHCVWTPTTATLAGESLACKAVITFRSCPGWWLPGQEQRAQQSLHEVDGREGARGVCRRLPQFVCDIRCQRATTTSHSILQPLRAASAVRLGPALHAALSGRVYLWGLSIKGCIVHCGYGQGMLGTEAWYLEI